MKNEFLQGIAFCMSYLIKWQDQPSVAAELLKESGYKLKDLKASGVDNYDLKIIIKGLKNENT